MEIPCHFMSQIDSKLVEIYTKFHEYSISFIQALFIFHAQKNVTRIFLCPSDGSLVGNETKSDGNPIIFLAKSMKIP